MLVNESVPAEIAEPETAVQQTIPELHGGNLVVVADYVHGVHLPQRQVYRQLTRARAAQPVEIGATAG